jgi:VWFA-related protein
MPSTEKEVEVVNMSIQPGFILKRVIFFALMFMAAAAYAQDPKPDEPIRIDTNLIQTDVTVLDKSGNFVDGLGQEQFVLKIDGKPVKVDFFERVLSSPGAEGGVKRPDGEKKANTASPVTSLRERKIVFFIDDFHLGLDSLGRTRSAIKHFIDYDMMPNDQVGIFTSSGQLGFLQQFTNNRSVLHAAVNRLRAIPNVVRDSDHPPMPEYIAVRIMNDDKMAGAIYIDKVLEGYNTKLAKPVTRAMAFDMVKGRANNIVSAMADTTKATLGSLENFLQFINGFSGRKIIFLLSDGFYLESKKVPYATTDALQRSIDRATRSGSSIYTIDARGLFSTNTADATGEQPFDTQNGDLSRSRTGEEAASQAGLADLADETGGRFLRSQNYFDKWIDRVLDENGSYYVLAWTPEKDEQLSKKFRNIEVEIVGRPDLKVRQQRGYLTSPEKTEPKGKDNKAKNAEPAPAEKPKSSPAKKNLPVELALGYLDVPNTGGVLSSSVQVAAGGLKYGEKGDQAAKLYIEGTVFNIEGKQVAGFKNGVTLNPPPSGGGDNARQSMIYGEKTPLAPGLYQVRARVGEIQTGNSGMSAQWIEIPDLSKKTLTLGSIFLGGKLIETAAKDGTTAAQFQFSVDHRFSRPVTLDFMSFIYNAARQNAGNGEANLSSRIEVLDGNGKAVIDTTMRPLATKGNPDMARIPIRGSIRQNLNTPGTYLLRITVSDNLAGTTTVQQAVFTVE